MPLQQNLRGEDCRLEVVRLHGLNWKRKQIAAHLGVCDRTVQRHLTRSGLTKPSRRKLTEQEATAIVARYAAGEGVTALGRAFDVSRGTVRMELRRAGVELHSPTHTKGIDTARVLKLHKAGRSTAEIAAELGVNPNNVRYHLFKALGGDTGRPARKDSKRDRTVEVLMGNPALSDVEIAAIVGVKTATVSKHLWQARIMKLLPAGFERA